MHAIHVFPSLEHNGQHPIPHIAVCSPEPSSPRIQCMESTVEPHW